MWGSNLARAAVVCYLWLISAALAQGVLPPIIPGGTGTLTSVAINAGTNITLSGSCTGTLTINCTVNSLGGSVTLTAGTNITLTGTCIGATISCTISTSGGGGVTAGSGLTLTGSVMSLGDANLTYSAGYVTLGASSATGGIKINTFNPNVLNNPNDNTSIDVTCGVQSYGNVNLNPLFTNSDCAQLAINTINVDSVYSAGNTNGQTLSKNTSLALNEVGYYLGAGQKILHGYRATCFGMSDCAGGTTNITFAGGPIAGDEGSGWTDVNQLSQQQFLSLSQISGAQPTQSTCNTTLTQSIVASAAPQTVTVASSATCSVNDWVIVGQQIPFTTSNEEAVQLTAVATGTITGIFRNNFNAKLISTLGTLVGGTGGTPGTYTNGGQGIPLTGGTGTGATATSITVTGTAVSAVTLGGISFGTNGSGYTVGDVLTASPSLIGGTTGFSIQVATTQGNTVTPAKVLNLNSTFQTGQDRILVDISQTPVTAGTVASISNNVFTGSGTSWTPGMFGGSSNNVGACIYLASDDDSISPFNGTGANGTLHSYYQILAVTDTTHLSIKSDSVAGDTSYQGPGPGSGGYHIYPCARIMYLGNANGSVSGFTVLETSSSTWAMNDNLETAINPYPDVIGFQYQLFGFTPGGAWRGFMTINNNGPVPFQTGISIRTNKNRAAYPYGPQAWGIGLSIDSANTGLSIGINTYTAAIQLADGVAAAGCVSDVCGNISWGTGSGAPFIGPNSTNLALQINWAGAARSLMTVIDTNSAIITGNHDLLHWLGGIQIPADAATNYQACGGTMTDTITVMTSGTATPGATVTAGALHVAAFCNGTNWIVM